MENETNDAPRQSYLSLDLFFGEDEPPPNKFHISDVRLVDLKKEERNIDDNNEESSDPNASIAEETIVEPQIVESETVEPEIVETEIVESEIVGPAIVESEIVESEIVGPTIVESEIVESEIVEDTFESEIVEDEDYSSEEEEEQCIDTEAVLEEDDEAVEEEYILAKMPSIYTRIPTRFTIQSDIEEVDEEEEKSATAVSEYSQLPGRSKLDLASATAMLSTDDLLLQAKNKMISRAASVLEQRLKSISGLKELLKERKKLTLKNRFLNDKCCEYLKKITTVDLFENTAGALPIYGNQAYYNVLEEFMDTKVHYDNKKPAMEMETQNLTDSYYICRARFEQVFAEFMSRELEVGSESIDAKTGKGISEQRLHSLVNKQQRKFDQLAEVRVYYLKLHNLLASIQNSLRALNLMGEGHTLMEYEQLVIVNNTSADKLDEREEELLKLRDECTQNITILNCMKQSFEAFAADIIAVAEVLKKVTDMKNEARSMLAFQRSKRDSVRKNSLKINSASGVLNSPRLLRKMEVDTQTLAVLKEKTDASRRDEGFAI